MCGIFFLKTSNYAQHLLGVLQFNWLIKAKGSVPWDQHIPLHLRCQLQVGPQVTYNFCMTDLATNRRFPWLQPLRIQLICSSGSLTKHFIYNQFIKGYDKEYRWRADEEIYRGKPGKVPSTGASLSVQLGCITLPVGGCSNNLEVLRIPYFGDFYGGFFM